MEENDLNCQQPNGAGAKVEMQLSSYLADSKTVDLTLRVYRYHMCTAQVYVNPD